MAGRAKNRPRYPNAALDTNRHLVVGSICRRSEKNPDREPRRQVALAAQIEQAFRAQYAVGACNAPTTRPPCAATAAVSNEARCRSRKQSQVSSQASAAANSFLASSATGLVMAHLSGPMRPRVVIGVGGLIHVA
jgi:hypothetical protein